MLLLALSSLAAAEDYALPAAPARSTGTLLQFTADHLDYEASSATLHLKGRVVIRQSTRTIRGDELWLDTRRRAGRSDGYLFVDDVDSAVASESGGEFDFESGAGRLKRASAGYGDWRIHAREARLGGRKKLDYLSADFTSCDFSPPHYRFHASRITVVPKSHLFARNVVFFLGPVPVLDSPFLYKSLAPAHLVRMKFQPGYDSRNGAYVKGTMITGHTPWLYSKLYLDYYSSQGVGTGLEFIRRKNDDSRGALFFYHVRENGSGFQRWALVGDGYQSLFSSRTASVALQGRLQVQSDPDFNNQYNRASTLRVTPDLINNGAVVYRLPKVTTRLSYSRVDVSPEQIPKTVDSYKTARYLKTSETYPRLDIQSASLKFWRLPWLNNLSGFADQNYVKGRAYLQREAGGTYQATRTFNLSRNWGFTPSASYMQSWFDKTDFSSGTVQDVFVGRYLTSNTLRWRTLLGSLDLTHAYTMRLKPDSFNEEASANDHGVESNQLSLTEVFRPSRKILVRASSAYDFRVFRDHEVGFRDRVQPIITDVVYTPKPTFNVTLRDDYTLVDGNRSVLGSMLYGDERTSYGSLALGYSKASPNNYSLDALFGLANASATWKIGGALRSQVGTTGGVSGLAADRAHLFEKEVALLRVWHDFMTRLAVRFRPLGVQEYSVYAQLHFGRGGGKEIERREWESEWFPERASAFHDRP